MADNKQETRASFVKDRVVNYNVGVTGITATNPKSANPSGSVNVETTELGELNYNASELLYRNLDKLGAQLKKTEATSSQVEDVEFEDYDINEISEEEMAQNLNKYMNSSSLRPMKKTAACVDNFCRNCGTKYFAKDNFCASCGQERFREN